MKILFYILLANRARSHSGYNCRYDSLRQVTNGLNTKTKFTEKRKKGVHGDPFFNNKNTTDKHMTPPKRFFLVYKVNCNEQGERTTPNVQIKVNFNPLDSPARVSHDSYAKKTNRL